MNTLLLIAGVLLGWFILAIAVAVWLILPAGRPVAKPTDLSATQTRLPKPLAMPEQSQSPATPTNHDRT